MKTLQSKTYFLFILLIVFAFIGCSSDDNKSPKTTDPGPLTEEEVHQVKVKLVAIIRDSGRDFPQYDQNRPMTTNSLNDLDDFLDGPNNYMETINEPGELKLRLWLDEERNIIPSPTWQQDHPNYCSEEGRYMRSARKLLEFKVMYDPDLGLSDPDQFAYGIQLNLIDIETSAINQSVWVDPIIDETNNWINATLNEAWDQMLAVTTIQGAVGPCENELEDSYYHITIEGYGEFSNTYSYDDEGMVAWYLYEGNGKEHITIFIDSDAEMMQFIKGGVQLINNQVVPLGPARSSRTYMDIYPIPGDFYELLIATSGTIEITNLETYTIGDSDSGAARFDMELDGIFDLAITEEVEQIHVTGTFHFSTEFN